MQKSKRWKIKARRIADYYHLYPTQFTPKSIKHLPALFTLYASQGWGEPSPLNTNKLFDLKSTPKQSTSGYFYFSQIKEKWRTGTVDSKAREEEEGKAKLGQSDRARETEQKGEEDMSQKVLQSLKKRIGDSSSQTPPHKRSSGDKKVSKSKSSKGGSSNGSGTAKTSPTTVVLSLEAKKGKDMLQYYLDRSLLKREVDMANKKVQNVRNELGEVKRKLLTANNRVDELTKEIQEMPSTTQLKADNEALSKEVNPLKDERESLRTLLSKLEEEVKTRQTREEELFKEAAKENLEAVDSTVPTDQGTKTPVVQCVEPPAPTDKADPYKEPRTPAI
uniref:Uncharacterized protein n=1 Tax=Cannabis sativa TaxID=3483 RepID=A0A803NIU7_CANSA